MGCNRDELDKICAAYRVKLELIDLPIGSEGYMAIVSGRALNSQEIKELEYKLTCACGEIKRVTIEIS